MQKKGAKKGGKKMPMPKDQMMSEDEMIKHKKKMKRGKKESEMMPRPGMM